MLVKYNQYNYLEPELEELIDRLNEMVYRNYASNVLRNLLRTSDFNMEESVKRVVAILRLTGIPVQKHITCIYRSHHQGIRKDWQMSELACSLVILNSHSTNQEIKDIQDEFLQSFGLLT